MPSHRILERRAAAFPTVRYCWAAGSD